MRAFTVSSWGVFRVPRHRSGAGVERVVTRTAVREGTGAGWAP